MIGLSIIAALLFMAMLCVVINKYGVPDMVSTIYYLLGKRGWVFQLVMMLFGAMMMVCLLDSGLGMPCLAFFACAGLMFGGVKRKAFENVLQKACSVICSWCYFLMRKRGNFAVSKIKHDEQILFIIGEGAC